MSTDYDFHCVTCGSDCNLGDYNHAGAGLASVLARRADVEAAAAGLDALGASGVYQLGEHGDAGRVVAFFVRHRGHEVRVRDEYGRFWTDCGAWFACRECGHSRSCVLPKGHAGEHSDKRATT